MKEASATLATRHLPLATPRSFRSAAPWPVRSTLGTLQLSVAPGRQSCDGFELPRERTLVGVSACSRDIRNRTGRLREQFAGSINPRLVDELAGGDLEDALHTAFKLID